VDYWGKDWEYSKGVCEKNARIGKVDSRVHFQKGDAAALEFEQATFDGAVSNLTFHEVKSVPDKRVVLGEALRVIKPGGRFSFVDYFYEAKHYGKTLGFEEYLNGLKLAQFEYRPLWDVMALPILLKHPKILGKVGIIYGVK
jgi:ubiquinone/menaquinone biosynthesis C-methylase UbiE